jgi:hypothetical protein
MKWIYTLPSLAFLQFAASSHNIDFVPITSLDADVVENSRTYIPVGNGTSAWSPATAHLITLSENALTTGEGAHIVAEINAAADYGSKGLREFSSNYEQVATDVERKRCDFSSGSRLDLTSVTGGSLGANENVAKIVWQVKELALMVKLGQVKKQQFSVLNENMINCINHLPGRHDNLKAKVSRDMAIFESVFNRKLASTPTLDSLKPSTTAFTFKSVTDQTFANYGEYYAANHGKTVYNHLFMNIETSNLTNLPETLGTSLKDSYDTFNCAHARSTILSNAGWADFERYALQVAFGEASTCGAEVTTFFDASLSIMTELNTLNEAGEWGTVDDLESRQLAYDIALNAIKQKNADVMLVDAMVSRGVIYLILFVVFLALLTFLGKNDRLMIDDLQKREDEMNSKPVKR